MLDVRVLTVGTLMVMLFPSAETGSGRIAVYTVLVKALS